MGLSIRSIFGMPFSLVAIALLLESCALIGSPDDAPVIAPQRRSPSDSCELRAASELGAEVFWRQTVEARYGDRELRFDAVLRSTSDKVTMVALAPVAGTLFALELSGGEVEYHPGAWPQPPFPPCQIFKDFQRAFFPTGEQGNRADGNYRAVVGGETVVETWLEGRIIGRVYRSDRAGRTELEYATPRSVLDVPSEVTVRNRARDYRLRIMTRDAQK